MFSKDTGSENQWFKILNQVQLAHAFFSLCHIPARVWGAWVEEKGERRCNSKQEERAEQYVWKVIRKENYSGRNEASKEKKAGKAGPNLNQLLYWIPDVRVRVNTHTHAHHISVWTALLFHLSPQREQCQTLSTPSTRASLFFCLPAQGMSVQFKWECINVQNLLFTLLWVNLSICLLLLSNRLSISYLPTVRHLSVLQ